MKIALLTSEYVTESGSGGIGTYVYHLARGLCETGHSVHVVTVSDNPAPVAVEDGVHVHRVGLSIPSDSPVAQFLPATYFSLNRTLATWSYFAGLVKEEGFEVVDVPDTLAEGIWNALSGALPMCVRLQTPLLLFLERGIHGLTKNFDYWLLSQMEKLCLMRADRLIAASEYLADYISQVCGVDRQSITIIRNPLCLDLQAKEKTGSSEDGITKFVFSGRLEKLKGVHILVEAFARACRAHPDMRLDLFGADTERGLGGGPVSGDLAEIVASHGLADKVRMLGAVPHQALRARLPEYDACVVPSLYDNAPYACVEAMAAGLAVIGADEGGMPEYLGRGERGHVVRAGNIDDLAAAMITVAGGAQRRQQLGAAARAYVACECDHKTVAERSIAIYEQALRSRGRQSDPQALANVMAEAQATLSLLQDHLYRYGPQAMEIAGYDKGYQAGLDDGKTDGYQRGQHDAIYQNPMILAIFKLQRLLAMTPAGRQQ